MSADSLAEVLRMAAAVAAADADHDLITALDVLNEDVLCPAGRPLLYAGEARQVAQSLLAAIPAEPPVVSLNGEVVAVNAWLVWRRRTRLHANETSGNALAELFRHAVEQIETTQDPETDPEPDSRHAVPEAYPDAGSVGC
jgi:hypothetical protein